MMINGNKKHHSIVNEMYVIFTKYDISLISSKNVKMGLLERSVVIYF